MNDSKLLKGIGMAALYFGIYFALREITSVIYLLFLQDVIKDSTGLTLLWDIFTVCALVIIMKTGGRSRLRSCGFVKAPLPKILLAIPLGIFLNFFVTLLFYIIPFPLEWVNAYADSVEKTVNTPVFFLTLTVAVLAPLIEETVFRGLIFSSLKSALPTVAAVLISSALFGIMHASIIWMLYAFLMGIVLSFMCVLSGSIIPSLVMHISFNITGLVSGEMMTLFNHSRGVPATIAVGAVSAVLAVLFCTVKRKA